MTDYLTLLNSQYSAYDKPTLSGVLRSCPEDFFVDEILGFEPEGEGEHVFLYIEKTAANTQFVAEQLAAFAKVAIKNVSFSGMKDRWAVTRQWFSVHLPGKTSPDFTALKHDEITVNYVEGCIRRITSACVCASLKAIAVTWPIEWPASPP